MSADPWASSYGTSPSLLQRAREQDADAWRRLVHLYSPLIFSWARRAGLGDSDAGDIVQDLWLAVAKALAGFQHERGGAFRGWLWSIARNKINDLFRKRKDTPAAAGGTTAHKALESAPQEEPAEADNRQSHELLRRALSLLEGEFEERTWRAFWRMTVDGQSAADVGAELDMAANAVHQAKFRVLRRLREEMAGLLDV